ncbi:hypothetical protein, partial [Burkholderia pseudomallei]
PNSSTSQITSDRQDSRNTTIERHARPSARASRPPGAPSGRAAAHAAARVSLRSTSMRISPFNAFFNAFRRQRAESFGENRLVYWVCRAQAPDLRGCSNCHNVRNGKARKGR